MYVFYTQISETEHTALWTVVQQREALKSCNAHFPSTFNGNFEPPLYRG